MPEQRSAIRNREDLRKHLWEAAEIEHQLMIQYLYAAFTLKKHEDESCTAAELEAVRRWGSTVFMVARQEMEHLALVNGILAAIGEEPYFARQNIGESPLQSPYFLGLDVARSRAAADEKPEEEVKPLDIPFLLERFDRDAVGRFVCAESPDYQDVKKIGRVPEWCFATGGREERATSLADWLGGGGRVRGAPAAGAPRLARTHLPGGYGAPMAGSAASAEQPFHPGSIVELYGRIEAALRSMPEIFTGDPARQVFIPVEYQINVVPITDLDSALLAIDLIVEEGEGIHSPPGYQTHFLRFFGVHDELDQVRQAAERAGRRFEPALPAATNPAEKIGGAPAYTQAVYHLFDHAYVTLLFVLTALYRSYSSRSTGYPYLGAALQNAAFGPFMTMVLRPIAEVLVYLKLDDRETAGPGFHIPPEDEAFLRPRAAEEGGRQDEIGIDLVLDRLAELERRLADVSSGEAAGGRQESLLRADREAWARDQLEYVLESVRAIANNVRRIYQIGELPQFVVKP